MDFDESRLYFSHQALRRNDDTNFDTTNNVEDNAEVVSTNAVRRHFREFLSE
jgi:hypothetical protein